MANKSVISLILMIIISLILIVITPIVSISSGLSNYGILEEYPLFKYNPDSPSPIEDLRINTDIGNIKIRYVDPPVDYFAKIELNIEMSGENIPGKKSSDYFDINWQDTSPSPSLTFEFKSGIDQNKALLLIKNITIFVALRKDIKFDLNITTGKGNIDLVVPFGVSINNILLCARNGNVIHEFNDCTINGNITGISDRGNIELSANDVKYTQNSIWNLTIKFEGSTDEGDILINIKQDTTISFNITGTAYTNKGDITIYYTDNNSNVGAEFNFYIPLEGVSPQGSFEGFTEGSPKTITNSWWKVRYIYYSDDFPAIGHYNISSYVYNMLKQRYLMNLKSA